MPISLNKTLLRSRRSAGVVDFFLSLVFRHKIHTKIKKKQLLDERQNWNVEQFLNYEKKLHNKKAKDNQCVY